jgi:hypothetical protein
MSKDEDIGKLLDDVSFEDGVLTIRYLVFFVEDGKVVGEIHFKQFIGADIDVELARNAEAQNFLNLKIEGLLTGAPALANYKPTFALADGSRKTIDKF